MKKWNLLDTAQTPEGEAMQLFEHDGDYSLRVRGIDLMTTRQRASEEKLAELGCTGLKPGARVLIGGLGFGFTLRAVLAQVSKDTAVVVAELMPAVVQWNSNPAYPLAAQALQDSRVEVRVGDVGQVIADAKGVFDSILLDIDNGPNALTLKSNDRLYGQSGIRHLYKALRKGGRACIWSVNDNPEFSKLLGRNGFEVQTQRTRSHATSGGSRTIFVAQKLG